MKLSGLLLLGCLILISSGESAAAGGIPYTKEEVMKLSFSNTTDNKTLLKAFNFVRNGDKKWERNVPLTGSILHYSVKNCVTEYYFEKKSNVWNDFVDQQVDKTERIFYYYDWNKVIWKSAKLEFDNGGRVFTADCSSDCSDVRHYIFRDHVNLGLSSYAHSFPPWYVSEDQIWFPVTVSPQRFNAALEDIRKECPGVISDY